MANRPVIEKFQPRELGPKTWGTEMLIAQTDQYIGKVMWMREGATGPLQHHVNKDETFYLLSGTAKVEFKDTDGALKTVTMVQGESYHIPPGAVHRVEAVTGCIFIEASTPHFEDRVAYEG